ncbi:hypothetical protein HWV00_12700 [Moritella sp. 24]|uniref:hypothetical protein n=1 Tax=Moritella sp. 24 TaxID=2746230 RepID=UPI001BA7B4E0|nr:hypothetical protein [Moritella sp. 24]QUM77029.1 hypothetical protein HWV00_12700 [Moritella sp. 24]
MLSFQILVDLGELALDKKYINLWFSWLWWLGTTSLLFVIYDKTSHFIPLVIGIVSATSLFFIALAMMQKVFNYLVGKYRDNGLAISISFIFLVINLVLSIGFILSMTKAFGVSILG